MTKFACFALILFSISSYGQDTLATIFPKHPVADTEAMFLGDTVLVRFIYAPQKKSRKDTVAKKLSEAAWYNATRKISVADVGSLGDNHLIGLKNYADSIYYYALTFQWNEIKIYKSAGLGVVLPHSSLHVEGTILKGLVHGNNFWIVTWDRQATVVRLYEIEKARIINTQIIELWPDAKKTSDDDVIFIGADDPARISASAKLLKFFLYDDTFCAVFDTPASSVRIQQYDTYKTRVYRKNLITGAEDKDIFMTHETFTFKSFLRGKNGNELYRFSSLRNMCELAVLDLDNDKVVDKRIFDIDKGTDAITRYGTSRHIEHSEMKRLSSRVHNRNWDIGLTADDFGDETIITIGGVDFKVRDEKEMTGFIPIPVPGFGAILIFLSRTIANDPNIITYTYFKGSPENGFSPLKAGSASGFVKIKVDNYELQNMHDRPLDYTAYYANNKYWIGLHSFVDSPRYFITKFPIKP